MLLKFSCDRNRKTNWCLMLWCWSASLEVAYCFMYGWCVSRNCLHYLKLCAILQTSLFSFSQGSYLIPVSCQVFYQRICCNLNCFWLSDLSNRVVYNNRKVVTTSHFNLLFNVRILLINFCRDPKFQQHAELQAKFGNLLFYLRVCVIRTL